MSITQKFYLPTLESGNKVYIKSSCTTFDRFFDIFHELKSFDW